MALDARARWRPDRLDRQDDEGWARLQREAALIAMLAAVGCRVPRVVAIDEIARIQVRSRLPGMSGHAIEEVSPVEATF
jgi:tRNA A-37 threonylcarbamoyl transferase component Bud32